MLIARRSLAIGAAAVLCLSAAAQAFAADTLDPPVVDVTVQAGGTTTVAKTLHLDGQPARADIIVAIDTTGSMTAALAAAKADAVNICSQVQAAIPGARFAAVEFQDYPIAPYGSPGDVAYELHTPGYTGDCTVFSAGVAAMTIGDGNDGPEANNRVHYEAYSDPVLLASRDPQATRFLVVLADNIPHSIPAFEACASTAPRDDAGRDGVPGTSDDLDTPETLAGLVNDQQTLLYVSYIAGANPLQCHVDMAEETGGVAVANEDAPNIGQFIIDQAEEVPYTVNLVVGGQCPPAGITFNPAPPYGPFQGEQTILFDEIIQAPMVPGTYVCTVQAVMDPGGPTQAIEQVIIRVTPADPFTLDLQPSSDVNTVDDQHCVTATVRDAFGNPTPGITVRFSVTGSVTTSGTGTSPTDANGQAEFCYTGPGLPGHDDITAYADTDNDNVNDPPPADPEDTATKDWEIPANQEDCKVTNGGWITTSSGSRATFGGNAMGSGPKGNETYVDHGVLSVKSLEILSVTCSDDGTSASIFGTASVNGAGEFDFRIDVRDPGEPGTSDRYRLRVSNGYDSGDQQLSGGNIQIH